jgi:hypothetical protein
MNLRDYSKTNPPPVGTLDRKGRAFDPAKHHPRVSQWDTWIPRGKPFGGPGREPAAPAPAPTLGESAAVETSAAPAASPETAAEAPGAAPAASPTPEPMPRFDDLEKAAGLGETPAAPASPPPPPDATGTPRRDAEVACKGLYLVTGLLTGAPGEAKPAASLHADLRDTLGAYLESRGIRSVGIVAVAVGLIAYFLDVFSKPESGGKLREWIGGGRKAPAAREPVTVEAEPVTPAPAATAATAAPAPAFSPFNSDLKF